jgi:DNA (cytosine-5)-methyltransferase 1
VCGKCHRKREQEVNALNEFLTYQQRHPLRALDAFGGSGALGMALAEGSSCFNVTHAIEIAPSAAKTYQKNSPDTLVLNTGISEVVQYIVKKNHGIELSPTDIPTNKETGEQVEFSMKPEDIEVVIAGFPWQVFDLFCFFQSFSG